MVLLSRCFTFVSGKCAKVSALRRARSGRPGEHHDMSAARAPLIGITCNSVVHTDADLHFDLDTRFRMVRDAGVFDYIERSPPPHELEAHVRASERYGIPIRAGGFYYTAGRDEALLEWHLRVAHFLGAGVQNVQLAVADIAGRPLSDEKIARIYLRAYEIGEPLGVTPCFEVHVNMWSEQFDRVERVADLVRRHGVLFSITLDPSHVIFKIDNPGELGAHGLGEAIAAGRLILDPAVEGNVIGRWISGNLVAHAHARPAVPNNPRNVWGKHPNGQTGRGIQYPFEAPPAGTWHAQWRAEALEPWKRVVRMLLEHHACHPASRLKNISTEILPFPDYGAGARYSLFDDSVACARWLRSTWSDVSRNQTSPSH